MEIKYLIWLKRNTSSGFGPCHNELIIEKSRRFENNDMRPLQETEKSNDNL